MAPPTPKQSVSPNKAAPAKQPKVIKAKLTTIIGLSKDSWKKSGGLIASVSVIVTNADSTAFEGKKLLISYSAIGTPPAEVYKDYWSWGEELPFSGPGTGTLSGCWFRPHGTLTIRATITVRGQVIAPGFEFAHKPTMVWVDKKVDIVGSTFLCLSPQDPNVMLRVTVGSSGPETKTKSDEKGQGEKGAFKSSDDFSVGGQYGGLQGSGKSGTESSRESSTDKKSGTSTSTTGPKDVPSFVIQVVKGGVCK